MSRSATASPRALREPSPGTAGPTSWLPRCELRMPSSSTTTWARRGPRRRRVPPARERLPQAIVVTATTPPLAEHIGLHPRSRERVERGMKALNEATRAVAFANGVMCLEFGDHPDARERDNYARDG